MPEHPKILYLITSAMSALLLRGQLDHVADHGLDVVVGTGDMESLPAGGFDASATVHDVGFHREIALVADLKALFNCIRLLRRERPDLVNFSTPKAGLIGAIATRLTRTGPTIYVVRGLRYETKTGLSRRLLKRIERFVCRSADHVVFNSQSALNVAVTDGIVERDRSTILANGSGNGIDVSRFDDLPTRSAAREELGLVGEAITIGFIGRLTSDKGIDDLVAAFGQAVAAVPELELLVTGSFEEGDPVGAEVHHVIAEHPRIHHVGWNDRPERVYAAMDICAFPSRREGLPNVVLEAQLCSVPIVGYAATGTVDAAVDGLTAILVPVGDVDGLASAFVDLANDAARRSALGRSGRQWVASHFDRPLVWAALDELYESVLDRGDQERQPARR